MKNENKKNLLKSSYSFENRLNKNYSRSKIKSDNNILLNKIIKTYCIKKKKNFFEKFDIYRSNLLKKYGSNSILNTKKITNYKEIKTSKNNNINIKVINKTSNRHTFKKEKYNIYNIFKTYKLKKKINKKKPLLIKVDLTKIDAYNNNNNNYYIKEQKTQKEPFKSYAFVEYPNKDNRESMEDFHSFHNLSFNNYIFYYFSIFDGYNGSQISLYLKNNFHKILSLELKNIKFTDQPEKNKENIISALITSFNKIDENILNDKTIKKNTGSTGTVILLYREPYDISKINILCSNVGDTKGYILNKDKIYQITEEHNCENKKEIERIKNSGGLVFKNRVFGSLIVTRSFGNREMKEYGVISTPYCFHSLINKNDLYAVICSDGVWSVCKQEDIYQLGMEYLSSENLAKKIVTLAIDKGSTDNISCLVIKLNIAN